MEPDWERDADIAVIGSGAAGISAALTAAGHGRRVLLLSKHEVGGGATALAQGGMAAAIGPDDSPALHRGDTLAAGAGLSDPAAAAALADAAPRTIARLTALGARLDRADLGLEAGHSRRRILHAGGDATGAEVHRVLADALADSRVEVLCDVVALDLLTAADGRVGGLVAGRVEDAGGPLRAGTVTARAVVVATGGFGQAFATTTSPAGVTGDGLALAARVGAELRDLEFVQFHPTVLWQPGARGRQPLVTEALRGAGAVLVDAAGRPVMAGLHPHGDLAPRDVVAAAMQEQITRTGTTHLYLDATKLGRTVLEEGFPTVTAACRARGIDPVTEPIPVSPGVHYACGGIRAGMDGRTSVPGLFAVGEAASTGLHGANRLASNSLTESLITGRRAGDLLGRHLAEPSSGPLQPPPSGTGVSAAHRTALAAAMSRHAGVTRNAAGLERLLAELNAAPPSEEAGLSLSTVEAVSLHTASVLVATAALARTESRGCHRRSDFPPSTPGVSGPSKHSLMRWHDRELRLARSDAMRIAVFAGSTPGHSPEYTALATTLGTALADKGIGLVYGGGRAGLMGALADAALAAGGEVTGVMPKALVDRERAHPGLTRLQVVNDVHERKAAMADAADAFVALPGGVGTLDELLEAWSWQQLGLHAKPLVLLGPPGFWQPLADLVDHLVGSGFVAPDQRSLLNAETPDRLLELLGREGNPHDAMTEDATPGAVPAERAG